MHEIVMRRYVKRPEAIEAIQLTSANVNFVANWCDGQVVGGYDLNDPSRTYVGLNVRSTDNQSIRVQVGDYIVREVSGRFTKLTADQFVSEYKLENATHRLRALEAKEVRDIHKSKESSYK